MCIANPDGTELALFSDKPRRPCLLVYHDDQVGYVLPISTKRPKRDEFRLGEGWVVCDRVYAVPVSQLSGTPTIVPFFHSGPFQSAIRKLLTEREREFLRMQALQQRPFSSLAGLKTDPPKAKPVPEPKAPSKPKDEDFDAYMKFDLDRDMKRHDLKDK